MAYPEAVQGGDWARVFFGQEKHQCKTAQFFFFEGVRTYLRHVLKNPFWEYGGKLIRKTRWKRLVDKELWICVLCPIIPENKGLPMHNRAPFGVGKLATS